MGDLLIDEDDRFFLFVYETRRIRSTSLRKKTETCTIRSRQAHFRRPFRNHHATRCVSCPDGIRFYTYRETRSGHYEKEYSRMFHAHKNGLAFISPIRCCPGILTPYEDYCRSSRDTKRMSGIHLAIPVFSKGYRPKQGKVAP